MAGDEDFERIGELAGASVAPIDEELRHRLSIELSDRQSLAIETALQKAFIGGMRAGMSEATERAMDGAVPPAGFAPTGLGAASAPTAEQLDPRLPWIDPWAERYGKQ